MHCSERVINSITSFLEKLENKLDLKDAVASIRIVGEFSSGKTRFVKELFGNTIPENLLPVASLEKQTYLPLEITYGQESGLYLIERASDTLQGKILKKLDKFPNRQEQEAFGVDQKTHRLRLEIPEPRLIMSEGDRYTDSTSPMRFAIIDMPGWNAGDSDIADNASIAMKGDWNIALVYVCKAIKLDSDLNRKLLKEFLNELSSSVFVNKPTFFYLITDCPIEETKRLEEREKDRLQEIISDFDEVEFDVVAVDFSSMTEDSKQKFRERFWNFIQISETPEFGIETLIAQWKDDMLPTNKLKTIANTLELAQKYLNLITKDDNYLKEILKIKKYSSSTVDINSRIKKVLMKHLGIEQLPVRFLTDNLELPIEHPLHDLWKDYYLKNYEKIIKPIGKFLTDVEKTILDTKATDNYVEYLSSTFKNKSFELLKDLNSSFSVLCRIGASLSDEKPVVVISTILTLTLLDARFNDYLYNRNN